MLQNTVDFQTVSEFISNKNILYQPKYEFVRNMVDRGLWCLTPLSTIFQLYYGSQFIVGGNRSAWKKPSTCHR
jgi:hypothetical protein